MVNTTGRTASNARRRQEEAHRRTVQVAPEDLLATLIEKLGPRLVAFIVNRDTTTISRWKKGVPKHEDALRPLMVAYQVFEMLEAAEAAPTIRAWFIGMNPQLDDESPAEAIREGRHREVMAAARAFLAGG